jgi:hypothetical protein
MHAILLSGQQGGTVDIDSRVERPAAFTDLAAAALTQTS